MARLTKREKQLICDLVLLAQAGEGPGVGDFENWTEKDFEKLDNIFNKLNAS